MQPRTWASPPPDPLVFLEGHPIRCFECVKDSEKWPFPLRDPCWPFGNEYHLVLKTPGANHCIYADVEVCIPCLHISLRLSDIFLAYSEFSLLLGHVS